MMRKFYVALLLITLPLISIQAGSRIPEKNFKSSYTTVAHQSNECKKLSTADSLHLFCGMLSQQGKNKKALCLISDALEKSKRERIFRNPWDISYAYYLKGDCERQLGRLPEAICDYQNAIKLNKKYHKAYRGQVFAYHAQEEYAKAVDACKKAMAAGDKSATCRNNLAMSYLRLGKYDKALEIIDICIEEKGDRAYIHDTKGDILLSMGVPKIALVHFNKAVDMHPNSEHYYNRGRCYEALCKIELAIQDYQRVINRNAERAEDARMRLNALRERFGGNICAS